MIGFSARVHPDDRAYVEERWSAAQAGVPGDIQFRVVVAGEPRWVHARADVQLDASGKLVSGIGTLQDITAAKRKAAEQRFFSDLGAVLGETLDYERTLTNLAHLSVREIADVCIIDIAEAESKVTRVCAMCGPGRPLDLRRARADGARSRRAVRDGGDHRDPALEPGA